MTQSEKLAEMSTLRGWRYGLFLGGLVGFISAALYPIIIYPMMHVDDYKKSQAENRKGINQEEIQPGNMKVWSDPFDRKK
ncbi:small integral membrane protein 20-like [Penaeus japonicus]|uniref:small integral membrane protein 20-like n=1 Tax=Penaeus japonicus TaxID=27405 RepID=UPI001C71121D|nr:small integral membrane protein 20-like [Penaeus japonicus]